MSLVNWLSKKQTTIETSIFGAKFVSFKHVMEALGGICYKIWMMSYVYRDNMSVINNTQQPESTLKNKPN